MSRPEALLERQVLAELSRRFGSKCLTFKNEVGEGYYGVVRPRIAQALAPFGLPVQRVALEVLDHHRVHFGLRVGSADLLALVSGGRACSIELKSERGVLSEEQRTWIANMQSIGVVAGVARSVDEAVVLVKAAMSGQTLCDLAKEGRGQ
jgi:hypothetical protein